MSEGRFDRALVIDWSAAATPTTGPDSCWVASGRLDGPGPIRVRNHPTRLETVAHVRSEIDRALAKGLRTLVAVDVSFGLAAGAAETLGLSGGSPWRAIWSGLEERVHEGERNANNRFEAAAAMNEAAGTRVFWGRPKGGQFDRLASLPYREVDAPGLASMPLERLRATEQLAGPGVITTWMLYGRGSVGGQVLTCLPHLERLRRDLGDQVAVWPFDGLGDQGAPVVLAETWFGLFGWQSERHEVRDAKQVAGTLRHFRSIGPDGLLDLLDPPAIAALTGRRRAEVLGEEGWTLGVR